MCVCTLDTAISVHASDKGTVITAWSEKREFGWGGKIEKKGKKYKKKIIQGDRLF